MTLATAKLNEKFAFYGTLREGHGNNLYLVKPAVGTKYEGTRVLSGYKMFDIGGKSYPFVVKTGNPEDTIVVELYHLPDQTYAKRIHWMELGSNFHVEELNLDDQTYWLYAKKDGTGFMPVPYGDWTKYKRGKGT
jgi:gamma-glutamylcyclotransferase (GGCT)/AIG2-like uncharacterized protein YtfP